jgi:polyhydroxybutyrate depolymerase
VEGKQSMSKLTALLLLTTVALLLQPTAQAADNCTGTRTGSNRITVQAQDLDLVLPASFTSSKRVPLVIGLHPSGGSGAALDQDTGLGVAATAKGFAVIFPDGGIRAETGDGHFWNIPGVPLVSGDAVPSGTRDDVRFLADIIDYVVKNNCVDPRRIYVTGFSGGARMSSMVGCRLADRVTAIAPVAGLRAGRAAGPEFTEPDAGDCHPSRALAVLALHGTDDPTNPFPGGGGLRWGYSVERAAARWAALDKCGSTPAHEKASAHVTRLRYSACNADSEVLLYEIQLPRDQGGGHIWPGGRRDFSTRTPARAAVNLPVELDATQVVLDFFARH